MEDVFHASSRYSEATHDEFIDRAYADARIDVVLSGPVRRTTFEHFWSNTNVLAVRDGGGSIAWLVHSINTPTAFGAGIVVDGVYAVRAINATHAQQGNLLAPGLFTNLALFRDGRPSVVAGSPGFGCMHGPIAFTASLLERKLDPLAAVAAPRFALPSPLTADRPPFESHYPRSVFAMLEERGLPYYECSPTSATGLVSALVVGNAGRPTAGGEDEVHAVQDVRTDGMAAAFAP